MTAAGGPLFALPNADADLVARAQVGDPDAFGRIFEQLRVPIFNFLYRYTQDRHRAEDLTQDTFVKAWRKIGETRYGDLKVAPWLYSIAHRVFLDSARHEKLVQWQPWDAFVSVFHPSQVAASKEQPERRFVLREDAEEVREILEQLPPHYRQALLLYEYHDLSYDEIARHFVTTRAAVKSILFRARAEFRRLYEHSERQPGEGYAYAPVKRSLPVGVDHTGTQTRCPYRARVWENGKNVYLGVYATEAEAVAARAAWVAQHRREAA